MKPESDNKDWQNPIAVYLQGMTQGANQETMHTLEKEQAGIKTDISTLKIDVSILKTDIAIIKNDIANIKDNMVTKAEFSDFKADIRNELTNVRIELKEDIAKLGGCIAMIRAESKEDIADVRAEISSLKLNMQGWMITILITIIGGIIALLYKS